MTESHSAPVESSIGDSPHVVEIDESLFPFDVVLKATYWLTGSYDVEVRRDSSREVLLVSIRSTGGQLSLQSRAEAERRLRRDLIDFRTRMLIDQETRVIRELLVAKAFDDGSDA